MYERRNALRVNSDQVKLEIMGQELPVEDISISGAKVKVPEGFLKDGERGKCVIKINYARMVLPFEFRERAGDAFIMFQGMDPDMSHTFLRALKNIYTCDT